MLNIVLFGPPGAGKGTQSQKLIDKFHFTHLSTGDLFRENISKQTELGNIVKEITERGELVPDEITISMLANAMQLHQNSQGFIFDGFPRTVAQAAALDKLLESKNSKIHGVVALDVSQDELKKRLIDRGKVSGRSDDEESKIIRRMEEYFNKTIHVLPYYQEQNKLKTVYGIGDVDEIFKNLCEVIESFKK